MRYLMAGQKAVTVPSVSLNTLCKGFQLDHVLRTQVGALLFYAWQHTAAKQAPHTRRNSLNASPNLGSSSILRNWLTSCSTRALDRPWRFLAT